MLTRASSLSRLATQIKIGCVSLAMFVALPGLTFAGEITGDPSAGLVFAQGHCASCHLVEGDWQDVANPFPPPFAKIAGDPKFTELSLKVFLRTPHKNMPDFILTDEETADVVAYILSLKPD